MAKRNRIHLQKHLTHILQVLLLFFLYFFTAHLGLSLDAVSGFATLFWLPSGISLAAVLLYGNRITPGIFFGALLANYVNGAPFWAVIAIAFGNSIEAIVGAFLLRKFSEIDLSLGRVRDILSIVLFGAFVSTAISATIGTMVLNVHGVLTAGYMTTWVAWWVGDMISILIITPLILSWRRLPKITHNFWRTSEAVLLSLTVFFVGLFVFWEILGIEITSSPLTYIIFPPLIWAAMRFGQREVATAIFIFSLLAVWGTISGHGPFVRTRLSESLLFLQSFMVVVSVTSMMLAAAIAERRALERRKDDFISFASHELKTPITSLKIFTQMLVRKSAKKGDISLANQFKKIDAQINKLIQLINLMLDVSQIQRSTLELKKAYFPLSPLIQETVSAFRTSSGRMIVARGSVPFDIYADKSRISQVISNLVSNAIKYSPRAKKIVVATKYSKDAVVVSVRDYGSGIAKAHQDLVFERFYRVTEDAGQTMPGLGIGLYLSRTIISKHGGRMWVDSVIGKGSTFYFSLPR